jgi:hypothetical protein
MLPCGRTLSPRSGLPLLAVRWSTQRPGIIFALDTQSTVRRRVEPFIVPG